MSEKREDPVSHRSVGQNAPADGQRRTARVVGDDRKATVTLEKPKKKTLVTSTF